MTVAPHVESPTVSPTTRNVERTQHDETPAVPADALTSAAASAKASASAVTAARAVRRGLPRVPGGELWPLASETPVVAATVVESASVVLPIDSAVPGPVTVAPAVEVSSGASIKPAAAVVQATNTAATPLRRGLPRVVGGEPWPPAASARVPTSVIVAAEDVVARPAPAPTKEAAPAADIVVVPVTASGPMLSNTSRPLPFTQTAFDGSGGRGPATVRPNPKRHGLFTKAQWAGVIIVGGGGLTVAAALVVLSVRWFLSLTFMQQFLVTYPGEYHLPEGAPVGIPPWLGWQHFFNVFLIVLIIRSGLQVRNEKRPSVFWSPRSNLQRKISLNLWLHHALDTLWIVNGVIYVVLLFLTGQWMKIVPTSWEAFPNAISAALQYVSLDWPTENGWVNYNALQQFAYFATVFIAAPLAIVTGVRMSPVWPKNAKTLSRIYPVEWARAVHFPVMLYFVAFVATHVILVLATGALRNLNHMYASLGSTEPAAYADNWIGFWLFVASLGVIAAAWIAARPLVLAPIAGLFGKISGR